MGFGDDAALRPAVSRSGIGHPFAMNLSRAPVHLLGATLLGATLLVPLSGPAVARLAQNELARVGIAPGPEARVPLALGFTEARTGPTTLGAAIAGRATLLLPVDYTCGNVCDPMLALSGAALAATGLRAGVDYGFVLVGLDPKDDAAAARRMVAEALGDTVPATALVGGADAIAGLTQAIGYSFVYDRETDAYAHPAAAVLLTPEGRVARVLSPLALNGRDLRLSLIEAGQGSVATLGDRLTLLCYGFDAVRGVYTPLVERILAVAAAGTIVVMALGLWALQRRSRSPGS